MTTRPDPRGPERTVESAEWTPQGILTRFAECDHVANLNATMAAPKKGEQVRCFNCGPHGSDPAPPRPSRIRTERFLLDPTAPDREAYEIRARGLQVATFVTGGVNGKSADDTAIGNLADASEYHPDELTLRKGGALPTYSNGAVAIAVANGGAYRRIEEASVDA